MPGGPGSPLIRAGPLAALLAAVLAAGCLPPPAGHREARLLAGLEWTARFLDDPARFRRVGPDYLLMLDELRLNPRHRRLARRAGGLLARHARRMAGALQVHFPPDAAGRGRFLLAAPYLYRYAGPARRLDRYFREALADAGGGTAADFEEALAGRDYGRLTDLLLEAWAARRLAALRPALAPRLPRPPWGRWLRALARLPLSPPGRADRASEQGYFLTHLVYVLTDFGARPPPPGALTRKLKARLLHTWPAVRRRLNDADLVAEYLHCLKILGLGHRPEVRRAQAWLAARQDPAGEFADAMERLGDAYDRFHPTWTALAALNYPAAGPPAPGSHTSLLGLTGDPVPPGAAP